MLEKLARIADTLPDAERLALLRIADMSAEAGPNPCRQAATAPGSPRRWPLGGCTRFASGECAACVWDTRLSARAMQTLRNGRSSVRLSLQLPVFWSHLKRCFNEDMPMLDITKDIQSLTTFRRRSGDFLKQLKKSKRPVVLTVKGKAAAIVQDAEAYQRLLDIAAQADASEGIRQGLEDAKEGRVRPAQESFAEFEARHALPR